MTTVTATTTVEPRQGYVPCGAAHPECPRRTCLRHAGHVLDGRHLDTVGSWADDRPRRHGYVTGRVPVITTTGVMVVEPNLLHPVTIQIPPEGATWIRVIAPVRGVMRVSDLSPWGWA